MEESKIILGENAYVLKCVEDKAFVSLSDGEIYKLLCNATYYQLTNRQYIYRNSEVLEYKGWILVWGFIGEVLQYILKNSNESEEMKYMNFSSHLRHKINERFHFDNLYGQLLRQVDNMGQFESFYPKFKEIEKELYNESMDYFKYWCVMANQMAYEKIKKEDLSSNFARFVNSLEDHPRGADIRF